MSVALSLTTVVCHRVAIAVPRNSASKVQGHTLQAQKNHRGNLVSRLFEER